MIKFEQVYEEQCTALGGSLLSDTARRVLRDYEMWFDRAIRSRFPDTPLREVINTVQVQHWPDRVVLVQGTEAFATYRWPTVKIK